MKVKEIEQMKSWLKWTEKSPLQLNEFYQSDCEILKIGRDQYLAMTTDSVAEEHILRLYTNPETVARVSVLASLSDLTAVGVQPVGVSSSILWPFEYSLQEKTQVQEALVQTLKEFSVPLFGGDSGNGRDLSLTVTGLGLADKKPVSRVGAREGDLILVLGSFGTGPALAFSYLRGQEQWRKELEHGFFPRPPLSSAKEILEYATSAMDTSDGLMTTLSTLFHLNSCGASLDFTQFDINRKAQEYCLFSDTPWETLLFAEHGDFNAVVTISEKDLVDFEKRCMDFQVIGQVGELGSAVQWKSRGKDRSVPVDFVAGEDKFSIGDHQALLKKLADLLKSEIN